MLYFLYVLLVADPRLSRRLIPVKRFATFSLRLIDIFHSAPLSVHQKYALSMELAKDYQIWWCFRFKKGTRDRVLYAACVIEHPFQPAKIVIELQLQESSP